MILVSTTLTANLKKEFEIKRQGALAVARCCEGEGAFFFSVMQSIRSKLNFSRAEKKNIAVFSVQAYNPHN